MSPKTDRAAFQRGSDQKQTQKYSARSLPLPRPGRKWRDLRELQAGGFLRTWIESREGRRA